MSGASRLLREDETSDVLTAPSDSSDGSQSDDLLLVAAGLRLEFGGVKALDDVSFTVRRREIYAIVGPNGAGKSSALNTISGLYKPRAGSVVFDGQQITGRSAPTLARMGLGRTFQNISLYAGMSVLDNVLTGRTVHMRAGLTRAIVRPWGLREEARHRAAVEEIIDFMRLGAFRHAAVETLGYGIRKRVDLARALAMEPRLLLLDEPMAGMNLEEKEDMARAVLDVRAERSCTLVLVEHDMGVVSDLADRVLVLDWGQVIAEGVAAEVLRLPAVVAAYLGKATV